MPLKQSPSSRRSRKSRIKSTSVFWPAWLFCRHSVAENGGPCVVEKGSCLTSMVVDNRSTIEFPSVQVSKRTDPQSQVSHRLGRKFVPPNHNTPPLRLWQIGQQNSCPHKSS